MRKRRAAVGLIASLAGILLFAALAPAAGTIAPSKLTASVAPPHRLKRPYRFTITGRLTYPKTVCPKGNTNKKYCVTVGRITCGGKIQIRVRLLKDKLLARSNKLVTTRSAPLRPDCTYRYRLTLLKSLFIARVRKLAPHAKGHFVGVAFFVTFLGNAQLTGKSARRQVVIAEVHAAGKRRLKRSH